MNLDLSPLAVRETDLRLRLGDQGGEADVAVVLHHPSGRIDAGSARLLDALGVDARALQDAQLLAKRAHDRTVAAVIGDGRPLRLVLVCVDPDTDDPLTAVRDAATIAGRAVRDARRLAVGVPALPALAGAGAGALEALVEGLLLGRYRYARPDAVADRDALALELSVVGAGEQDAGLQAAATRGRVVADAANWVRDLVTTPPADKTPETLAEGLRAALASVGASVRVWSHEELEASGFRGILAVAAGSPARAAMVEVDYQGGSADDEPVALIGKGVTFDSGGLDLKPLASMYTMKCDMGGAAAVAAAIYAAAKLELPVNVRAAMPLVENMPSGTALRPGDVIRHLNGTTSEVVSPDAEGRLILADAIAHVGGRGARSLVAVSTLTGATAVGTDLWGVFAGAPDLGAELVAAGLRAGEPGWQLPLWRPYRAYLDSDVADLRNINERQTYSVAGIIGSLFLGEFVPPEIPWAHIDIAATVLRNASTQNDMWPAGATGSPSRALIRWLEGTASA